MTRSFLLSPEYHYEAFLPIWALQVPAVESGVLRPPAHIAAGGWCKHLLVESRLQNKADAAQNEQGARPREPP
jgi:hypothetical protein